MKLIDVRTGNEFEGQNTGDIVSKSIKAACSLNHSCRRGVCGQCAGLVRQGTFSGSLDGTSREVFENGKPISVLMCQTFPRSDLVIDCNEKGDTAPTRPVRIDALRFPTPDVVIVTLEFMDDLPFTFEAGKFVAIRWMGDRLKYFSIGSKQGHMSKIELHIRKQVRGEFTGWLFKSAREGDILGLDGPFGSLQSLSSENLYQALHNVHRTNSRLFL